ncbi:MAG: membrane protein insertase YidC [Candidatus Brocadiales bacterium]
MDRQSLLALVIGSLLILGYYAFFLPWMYPPQKRQPAPRTATAPLHKAAKAPKRTAGATAQAPKRTTGTTTQAPVETEREVLGTLPQTGVTPTSNLVLENENLKTVWSNRGATLTNVTLKKYKDYSGKDLRLLLSSKVIPRTLAINRILDSYDLSNHLFLVKEVTPEQISFQTTLENGLRLTKNVSLHKRSGYRIDVQILIENTTANEEMSVTYSIVSASQIQPEGIPDYDMASVVGLALGTKTKLIQKTLGTLKKSPEINESHGIIWTGGVNKYFACVLKPTTNDIIRAVDSRYTVGKNTKKNPNLIVSADIVGFSLLPGDTEIHEYFLFVGPKKEDVLKEYGLVKLLNFGAITPLSKGLLQILNAFYSIVPNYGFDIIILTFCVKAMLFPLTRKSQTSMLKMQGLQPQIKELQEKYKHDKKRMGEAQMALFKKQGVSPMSGCLPILLQMPIFYALFRTLQLSFEMRQAPFALWIQDLSRPDMLYTLSSPLPFLGDYINALPIIMACASIVQMRLMPSNPDPKAQQQQQLMKFMPIMFAFILYQMPAGLLLYWTTSTILSVGEQILIRRMVAKAK